MRIRINLWQQIKPLFAHAGMLEYKSVSLRLLTKYTLELILQLTDQATDSKYHIRIHTNPSLLSLGRCQINAGFQYISVFEQWDRLSDRKVDHHTLFLQADYRTYHAVWKMDRNETQILFAPMCVSIFAFNCGD